MKKYIYLPIILLLCTSNSYANDIIKALDLDKDNLVTMEEAKILPELLAQFDTLDTNQDKMLDATEILAFQKAE